MTENASQQDAEKINRRKRKYAKTIRWTHLTARQAYSRHDNGEQPQDISDDVPPDTYKD